MILAKIETLDDGAVDQNGDLLPILSKSSSNVNIQKLLDAPLPDFSKETPGSPFWTKFGIFLLQQVRYGLFREDHVSGIENIPIDRGNMVCAWHTNGLVDPMCIYVSHPHYFVLAGRHDLVTRPILRFWTKRMAFQPVLRKAELLRGGCTQEEADYLNGRSLLKLAQGIASSHSVVLFPEGTSHSDAWMMKFRTGPMRTVLAAAALAKSQGKQIPVVVPCGLHFRKRHIFRTDAYVEFGKPIEILQEDIPNELVEAVSQNDWVEPGRENVVDLRDRLHEVLRPMTPDFESHDEHSVANLIGHYKARMEGNPYNQWDHEVRNTRTVREFLREKEQWDYASREPGARPNKMECPVIESATKLESILSSHKLNGRDLDDSGEKLSRFKPSKIPFNFIILLSFLAFSPLFVLSMGIQIFFGQILGNNTDEGLDARTTFHLLTALFGSTIIWPVMAFLLTTMVVLNGEWLGLGTLFGQGFGIYISSIPIFMAIILLFRLSCSLAVRSWDICMDFFRALRRLKCARKYSEEILLISKEIKDELAAY